MDAATFENEGASGIGFIARNHDGHLILAKTRRFSEVMNPTLVEAMAVEETLSWAKEMEWQAVVIEFDCLVVMQLIRSACPMRARLGKIIEECRALVSEANNLEFVFH